MKKFNFQSQYAVKPFLKVYKSSGNKRKPFSRPAYGSFPPSKECVMQSNAYFNFMIIFNVLIEIEHSNAVGYSFAKFIGPVAGAEQKVYAAEKHQNNLNSNANHGYRSRYGSVDGADYFAKPDYHFSYGVEDSKTGVLQNHKETRNGDKVKGEYR